jgi:hypothetical protein
MFIEAVLTRSEIHGRLEEAFPLSLRLGDPSAGHTLDFSDLGDVTLVPNVGLHVTCKARVHWPLLGIDVPVVLHSLRLVVIPKMRPGAFCDVLTFQVALEHAGVTGIPDAIEHGIIEAINRRLVNNHVELAWDFSTLFAHVLALPRMIEPLDAALLRAAWGRLRITEDALVIAVSVHGTILRRRGEAPPEFAPILGGRAPSLSAPAARTRPALVRQIGKHLLAASLAGLTAGAVFFTVRAAFRTA